MMTWPDGGSTPFKGEKATNWEGGFRVPCVMRWPGVIKPGTIINDMCAHEDFIPTFAAAAGEADIVQKVRKGHKMGARTFKVHLDGHNLMPLLKGDEKESPREGFLYWSDEGSLAALRYDQWKLVFMEQRRHSLDVWQEQLVPLRLPKLFTLRGDPFERAEHEGIGYSQWRIDRIFALVPAQAFVDRWLSSLKEFPPRQKPASFGIDEVMEKLSEPAHGAG